MNIIIIVVIILIISFIIAIVATSQDERSKEKLTDDVSLLFEDESLEDNKKLENDNIDKNASVDNNYLNIPNIEEKNDIALENTNYNLTGNDEDDFDDEII